MSGVREPFSLRERKVFVAGHTGDRGRGDRAATGARGGAR